MKQILINKGRAYVEEIPAPKVSSDTVLVQVSYSCISIGTEMSTVSTSGETLLDKVRKQPEKITKAVANVKKHGLKNTIQKVQHVQSISDNVIPLGYSAAGIVVEVGSNIKDIEVGSRVACAGAGVANHAEYIEVPRNLLVKVPDGVHIEDASTVTLGAIAMQGVRRADVRLGEFVGVIGLGILGQITVQLLKASGCKVIGIDLNERRIQLASELGMDKGFNPGDGDVVKAAHEFSGGFGIDTVIIAAATTSKEPLAQAFKMSRKKGKVILVGVVGMEINRDDMYLKELDFYVSTSYGPGRYDDNYELKGNDYPYAYVRWTENRNMQEYLNLISENKMNVRPLIDGIHNINNASKVYAELKSSELKPLIVLLEYDQKRSDSIERKIEVNSSSMTRDGKINIAVIGAGNYSKVMHLPSIVKLNEYYNLYAIASKSGSTARSAANKFGAKYAVSDYGEILKDEKVDAVIIATRHHTHAQMAIDCLKAGKAVLLEKPMAMKQSELNNLVQVINDTKIPFLVGFNRRFSKYAKAMKEQVINRSNPIIINYQMNAGYVPLDHWVHTEEGGGRIIGEACHIFDLFNYFTESEVESIFVNRITPKTEHISREDNAVISLKYKDGSVCTLTYTALGDRQYPKEVCQVYVDGKILILNDYKSLEGYGLKLKGLKSAESDKGQYEQMIEFAKYVKGEIKSPIPLWQMIQATEISFIAERL